MRPYLLPVIIGLFLTVVAVASATAHAVLLETIPEDAIRLEVAPGDIRLRFNEPVHLISARLGEMAGTVVGISKETRDATVRLVPITALPVGRYTVEYRVASRDGHPVSGTIGFGVGAAPPPEEGAAAIDGLWKTGLLAAARAVHYGGSLGAIGTVLFFVFVARMDLRLRRPLARLAVGSSALALLGGVGEIVLAETGLAGLATAGLAIILPGLAKGRRLARSSLVVGAVMTAASLALTGHAALAPPMWLSMPMVALHVLAASFWIGSLFPLTTALHTLPRPDAVIMVERFSRMALTTVFVIIVAGAIVTVVQLSDWQSVWHTDYGRFWISKMAGVFALLGLAALNRLRLSPALRRGDPKATGLLILSLRIERLVAAAVVVITSGLGAVPPPRTLILTGVLEPAPAALVGYATLISRPQGSAIIEVTPADAGRNRLIVRLSNNDSRLPKMISGQATLIEDESPNATPTPFPLAIATSGHSAEGDINFSPTGPWRLNIEITTDALPPLILSVSVPVKDTSSKLPKSVRL